MLKIFGLLFVLFSVSAMANYQMATTGKKVVCLADDNVDIVLNAKRTTVKFTIEGETRGAKKITKVESDESTYVSYSTSEGTLTLSDSGDTYKFTEEDAFFVDCH